MKAAMKPRMLGQGLLCKFIRAEYGRAAASGESVLELVAAALEQRHGLSRAGEHPRKFIERHRDLVCAAPGDGKPPAAPLAGLKPPPLPEGVAVASDAFLQSFEWRRVRMVALKKYGARCQCCGASPADGAVMNVDHIKPRRIFPALALDVDNLQVLCGPCNHGKGNWDMTDWRGAVEVP